ncbi:uncharacterized protein C8R40DRAFT_1067973 [Lentinula edodes]|uniref:uncharacterized protein n=1 Tax=Lentinula edodes TaxID=5353 RepID=UPI001E8E96D7|nr:uncharacterized protein C8R40DRAFT_1067973 [Lentinula edodes]KAH7877241.1 hypothetical protein C8R40DRAFT_1067973 [Lentinula edodes]KAJ3922131.1 hypothetical protein F5877DRAFT_64383 [Lentinula edodes]
MNLSSVYLVLCLLSSAYSAAIYPRQTPFRGLRVKVISVEVTYTEQWAGIGNILHKAIIDGINAQCEEVEGIKFSEVKDSMVKWVTGTENKFKVVTGGTEYNGKLDAHMAK